MQQCILNVCVIYCIQFTINAHRQWISFSTYSCFNRVSIIRVAVYVTRMLHTCYNLPYHRYNHQFVQKLFWSSNSMIPHLLDCFPARLSICSRHVFCVNATHLAKNGHPTTAKIRPMNLQQYLYQGRFYLPWYSNTSFNTLLSRFWQFFTTFWHYLA